MYPARTVSVALFAWPRCIDEFAFDWQRIRNLVYSWRVRVCWPSGHWNESDFSYALAVESGPMRKNKRELLSPEVGIPAEPTQCGAVQRISAREYR